MGTFVFRWPHPANEVHVTGTFDDWGKSEQLEKVGNVFEKEVHLPSADEKYYYKFVVDDNWITDHEAPQEEDGHYNVNNVLLPSQIKKHTAVPSKDEIPSAAAAGGYAASGVPPPATISSVGPQSTTAGLAGGVPLESSKQDDSGLERTHSPPGAFPETPAHEAEDFRVSPIPASGTGANPISLPAGEKVPDSSTYTSNTIDSTATTSKEDYEKDASAAFPAVAAIGAGAAGAVGLAEHEKKEDEPTFSVNPIPASSGSDKPNTIQSTATTSKEDYERDASATFAGTEKNKEEPTFGVDPIPASGGYGNPISVPAGEKVPYQSSFNPNTVQSTATTSKEDYERDASATALAGGLAGAAAGGVAAAGLHSDKKEDTTNDSAFTVPEKSKNMIPESSLPMGGAAKDTTDTGPFIQSAGPQSTSAYLASTLPLEPKREAKVIDDEYEAPSATLSGPAEGVPQMVVESLEEAHQAPEAAASAEAVQEKKAVESELLDHVKTTNAVGEPAPTAAAATSETAPSETKETSLAAPSGPTRTGKRNTFEAITPGIEVQHPFPDAPHSKPSTPAVTEPPPPLSGTSSAKETSTPSKPAPASATSSPASTATKEQKKKNRRSFFGKLKDKLKDL